MKNLELYEKFTEQEDFERIKKFCDTSFGKYYKINKDMSVDVHDDVYFQKSYLNRIPLKFNKVDGNFSVKENIIDVLEDWQSCAPKHVKGYFDCSNNKLTTLLGGPKYVGRQYFCHYNNLKDVYGFPESFSNNTDDLNKLYIYNNPVYSIINVLPPNYHIRFIHLLNDYHVIRNGDTIVQDRLEEAYAGMGFDEKYFNHGINNTKNDCKKDYKFI